MRRNTIFTIACLFVFTAMQAQEAEKKTVSTYFRNSITSMMVYHAEDEFGYDVWEIFSDLPPFEKYDENELDFKVIDNSKITGVKKKEAGFHRQTYGSSIVLTAAEKRENGETMLKLLNDAEIGKRIVARWFNFTGTTLQDAHFDTKTLMARSSNNANLLDVEKARLTVDGMTNLVNVSDELISHSFVLVSDMTYITAEARADAAKKTLNVLGGIWDAATGGNSGRRLAEVSGDIADQFTGFKVMTHTYLFQLVWNDSLANEFYTKYYTETPDEAKIRAFLTDENPFKLKYLGTEDSRYEKTETKGKYDRTDLLQLITVRSIDKNIATLQGRFEDFRIKTPVTSIEYDKKGNVSGVRAMIGEKEDVTESSKFEVLECKLNKKGRIEYSRVALLKPVRNHIWDNRFNAILENPDDGEIQGTLFKITELTPGKEVLPGMIVRQTKG